VPLRFFGKPFFGGTASEGRACHVRVWRDLLVRSAFLSRIIHSRSVGTTSVPLRTISRRDPLVGSTSSEEPARRVRCGSEGTACQVQIRWDVRIGSVSIGQVTEQATRNQGRDFGRLGRLSTGQPIFPAISAATSSTEGSARR